MRNCVHIPRTSTNQQEHGQYIMSRYKFMTSVMGSHLSFYDVMGSF